MVVFRKVLQILRMVVSLVVFPTFPMGIEVLLPFYIHNLLDIYNLLHMGMV